MRPRAAIFLALALMTSACAGSPRRACIVAGALAGALVVGGTVSGVVLGLDCGPGCVESKIRAGEPIHEAVQHHVNRRDDALLYGALPSALAGAALGGLIASHYCAATD